GRYGQLRRRTRDRLTREPHPPGVGRTGRGFAVTKENAWSLLGAARHSSCVRVLPRRGQAGWSAGVGAQPVGPLTLAQLGHDLALDLAHALARETEQLADLVEGARLAVVQAEAQPDDLLFALVEGREHAAHVTVQQAGDHRGLGRGGLGIL